MVKKIPNPLEKTLYDITSRNIYKCFNFNIPEACVELVRSSSFGYIYQFALVSLIISNKIQLSMECYSEFLPSTIISFTNQTFYCCLHGVLKVNIDKKWISAVCKSNLCEESTIRKVISTR